MLLNKNILLLVCVVLLKCCVNGDIINNRFGRNINIQTLCGEDGTKGGTCPTAKGTCAINPLANNLWTTTAYCVCKPGFFGDNCSDNPCSNFVCENQGTCSPVKTSDGSYSAYCQCPPPFFGNKCQYKISDFLTNNRIPKSCPSTYGVFGGGSYDGQFGFYCYNYVYDAKPWAEADQFCKNQGGHLAVVNNMDEWQVLKDITPGSYWIGAKTVNQAGTWVDGSPLKATYFWWETAAPTNGIEQCVLLKQVPDRIDSMVCTTLLAFICEIDL